MASVPNWARTAARTVFALAGVGFLVWAFLAAWERSEGLPVAPWPRLLAAAALGASALAFAVRSWAAVLELRVTRELAWGFFLSQLGKYVPGGVWQAVGQVGYATRLVSPQRAAGGFAVFAVVQAAAGGVVGAFLVLAPQPRPVWLRLAPLAGPLLLLLLHRPWLLGVVRLYGRVRGRSDIAGQEFLPCQAAMVRAVLWSCVVHLFLGAGFALTLPGDPTLSSWLVAVPAFPLAWTIGFLALPFPAGVGIREGVLIALLPVSAAAAIAASVIYRLVLMVGEVLMIGTARVVWPADTPRD